MYEINNNLRKQYERIIEAIESEGLEYAIVDGGYIKPNTDDDELNKAIINVKENVGKIREIIKPYYIMD